MVSETTARRTIPLGTQRSEAPPYYPLWGHNVPWLRCA